MKQASAMHNDRVRQREAAVPIALWGAGSVFRAFRDALYNLQQRGDVRIVAVADEDPAAHVHVDGAPFVHPSELSSCGAEYVLTMSKQHAGEMARRAVEDYGLPQSKLLGYGVLRLRGFDFRRYRQLRALNPSIVSNSSWGALAFRFLSLDPQSPLVGTGVRDDDFIRLLKGLDEYLAIDAPVFTDSRIDAYDRKYLVGMVGDIPIRFFDPHTEESAALTWANGCRRLQSGSVIAQMHTLDPECEKRFDELQGFASKLCFVPYKPNTASSVHVPLVDGDNVYSLSIARMFRGVEKAIQYDVLGMLMGQSV